MYLKILNLPIKMLKVIGLHPKQNSWKNKATSIVMFISTIIVLITVIIEIYCIELTIVNFAPLVEAFGAAIEVLHV